MAIGTSIKKVFIPQSDKSREDWIAEQLSKLKKGTKILDAGAGECYYAKYCKHLQYTGQDFAQYDGKGNSKGIQTGTRDSSKLDIVSDIVKIPVQSGSFDNVLCVEVFEHIPDPISALKELARINKKGGKLILTAPFSALTHYSPYFYYSGFSENFYKENLPKFGYKIEKMFIYGNYFDYITLEILRTPLIMYRQNRLLFIPCIIFYPVVIPAYIYFRIMSTIYRRSSELLYFGVGIVAKRI